MSDRNSIQKYYEKNLNEKLPKKSYTDKFLELSYVNDPVKRNKFLFGVCLGAGITMITKRRFKL